MTKFNVGDKVRVVDVDAIGYGKDYYYNGMETEVVNMFGVYPVLLGKDGEEAIVIVSSEFRAIERITDKPKKSARITALETQVATLQAKVEALETAGKYPLTAQFERESTSNCEMVDGILADIERKAKPTLEALLATYPTANEQRADVIKRAKAFVAKNTIKNAEVVGIAGVEFGHHVCHVEFIANTEKRAVTLLAKGVNSGKVRAKGIAKCDPDDVFNADIGKAIALARALGVEVPLAFIKAVQPTEIVLGHRVYASPNYPNELVAESTSVAKGTIRITFIKPCENDGETRILDDTDAVYE